MFRWRYEWGHFAEAFPGVAGRVMSRAMSSRFSWMNRPFLAFLVMVWASPATSSADLTADIRVITQDKLLARARVGVQVIRLGQAKDNTVVASLNAAEPHIPASNLKLVTTAAALERLGRDFKFRTVLIQQGKDIALIGDGDPTLGDAEMLRKVGWETTTAFAKWAEELKRRGITDVNDVLVDDSIFDQTFAHPNWPVDQLQKRYVAEVGGLSFNANCVDFVINSTGAANVVRFKTDPSTRYINVKNSCVSGDENKIYLTRAGGSNDIILKGEAVGTTAQDPVSVTIHDPPLFAGTVLAETLQSNGVKVTGITRRDRTVRTRLLQNRNDDVTVLAVHETPLSVVLARANKDSMNLYAESLCKRLGAEVSLSPGSWQNGTAATADFVRDAGVAGAEYIFDDGCGLSKKNRISAHALTQVLAHVYASPNAPAYMQSLSIAGSDGTLQRRFSGSDLRGRVFGKSGFVNGVSSLSGYLQAKSGEWYAFSILFNGIPDLSNSTAKLLQERIVAAIDKASVQ